MSLLMAPGGTRAAEDHHVLRRSPPTAVADDPARVLAKPGGLKAGAGHLAVGVGVQRHDLVADVVLEEGQGPPPDAV